MNIIIDEQVLVDAMSALAYLDYATEYWYEFILVLDFDRYTGLYLSLGMMIAGILSYFGSQIPIDPDNKNKEMLEKIKKSLAVISKPLIIVGGIGFIVTLLAVVRADAVTDTKDLMRQSIDQGIKNLQDEIHTIKEQNVNTAQFMVRLPEELKSNILNMQVNENGEIVELIKSQSNLFTDIYGNVWNNVDGVYVMVEQNGVLKGVIQNYIATNIHSVNINPSAPTMTVYHVHSNPVNPELLNNNFVIVDQNNNVINQGGQVLSNQLYNPDAIIDPNLNPNNNVEQYSSIFNTYVNKDENK